MMHIPGSTSKSNFKHYKSETYSAVVLPYSSENTKDTFSMYIILPKDKDGLSKVVALLTDTEFKIIHDAEWPRFVSVDLKLPKFTIENRFSGIQSTFKNLGMGKVFDNCSADFSNMGPTNLSGCIGRTYIEKIIHKAKIEVDEEGTKAAAATAVMMGVSKSAHEGPSYQIVKFHADHPFAYAIVHDASGAILFWGQYTGNK